MNLARSARLLLLVLLFGAALVSARAGAADGPDIDQAWVDGTLYHFLATGPAAPTTQATVVPLYVIAPVDPSRPLHPLADAATHGFGAHDHVLALTGEGAFSGVCDLTLVVPGPNGRPGANVAVRSTLTPAGTKPLVYAANLGHGLEALISSTSIQTAASLGLVTLVDTTTMLQCLAGPAAPAGCGPDPAINPYTWPGAAALGVTIAPCGAGWVRSTPYLIDCPFQCLAPLAPSSTITLRATPARGQRFSGWSGPACSGQGDPCTVTIPASGAINAEADFVPITAS